ncbi:MAG: pyruvate formate lyase family protein, partial [Clostridiales bacterium]|nr:pyruvate formate lyase family protein [Clostridiales bacterium]
MNERVQKLREQSVTAVPHICPERARYVTETYKKYEGTVSIPELRALAFKNYLENKTIVIYEGELIVGEKGAHAQGAPTFPELCCHSLDDLEVMNRREHISFAVSAEAFVAQRDEIIPFWERRSIRNKIFAAMPRKWKDCYEAGIFTEFMEQRGPGHTVGSRNIFIKGFKDYKEEINAALARLDYINDPLALDRRDELNAMLIACDAIITFAKRYARLAQEMAAAENDPARRAELSQIAENCETVPANKPSSYWQAIQAYWFVHIGVTTEINPWDAFSPGRLDQHLNPFYIADCANGILDECRAKELLECLWIKFNNQPAPPKVGITLKESSTYTDFANINTGGITEDGEDGVNDVSYLILDCMDETRLLQPSSNVQISKKTPARFLKRACEISRKGWGQPAFYNTDAIVAELLNAGKSIDDARRGGASGCVETGAFGSEAYILTGYFNLPKILELTLYNGYDRLTKKQLGLELGYAADFKSYEDFLAAYKK